MPNYRKRANQKSYSSHTKRVKKLDICDFCKLEKGSEQYISSSKHFKIIRNIFPYDHWDGRRVVDHIMIVPIKHTEDLSSLGDNASIEFVKLVSDYESKGYDLFARSPQSTIRSVAHQHTHLIKTAGKRHKSVIFIEKPYISITF